MKIILAGGGTAGHINPAIAIAKYICSKEKDAKILFVGNKNSMESTLVAREGFAIKHINAQGFKTNLSMQNIVPVAKFFASATVARQIILRFRPDVVIGTGGYVCAPTVFAANFGRIPTIIHEQNVFPGSAIRFLCKKSSVTAISFAESEKYLTAAKRVELTGNPIRPPILKASRTAARREFGLKDEKFVVVCGGSLGAAAINDVAVKYIKSHAPKGVRVLLSTGERNFNDVNSVLSNVNAQCEFEVVPYIHNMDAALAAADIVINRAGAITLSELCALGKPSILVPSPNVANNHQEYNAAAMERVGAAVMIAENDLTARVLAHQLDKILFDEHLLAKMGRCARQNAVITATESIYQLVKELSAK